MFQQKHLAEFKKLSKQKSEQWLGSAPASWYRYLMKSAGFPPSSSLSQTKLSRSELFALAQTSTMPPLECAISVLAWGGMNRKHGAKALSTFHLWRDVVEHLRDGSLGHRDAFERFQKLRAQGNLKGMGIAYFTKLIYFLSANPQGYILDQWTARSTNLLHGKDKILLTWGSYKRRKFAVVNDKNTVNEYDFFCQFVNKLTLECDHLESPGDTEEALFSVGRTPDNWREYLKRYG